MAWSPRVPGSRRAEKERARKRNAGIDHGMKSQTPVPGSRKVRQVTGWKLNSMVRRVALPRTIWLMAVAKAIAITPAPANTLADFLSSERYSKSAQAGKIRMKASDCIEATASSAADRTKRLRKKVHRAAIIGNAMKVAGNR